MMTDATTNKLILLYIFDQMETPLSEETLIEICNENDWLSYMDCQASYFGAQSTRRSSRTSQNFPPYIRHNEDGSHALSLSNKNPTFDKRIDKEEVSKTVSTIVKDRNIFPIISKRRRNVYGHLKILPSTDNNASRAEN